MTLVEDLTRRLPMGLTKPYEASAWLTTQWSAIRERLSRDGGMKHCGHVNVRQGEGGIVPLWEPDKIVCLDCAPRIVPATLTDGDRCDRCGEISIDPDLEMHVLLPTPYIGLIFGLCLRCDGLEDG